MKRIFVLCLTMCIILSLQVDALEKELLYRGYSEDITENITNKNNKIEGIRIKDISKEDDSIVYYYDDDGDNLNYKDDTDKSYYFKIKNYIEKNDDYIDKYGIEKKKKVSAVLMGGYPIDIGGIYKRYKDKITEDEARYVTQALILNITNDTIINKGNGDKFDKVFTKDMKRYYNSLCKKYISDFKEDYPFKEKEPFIMGNMTPKRECKENGDTWRTGNLRIKNISDTEYVKLLNLNSDMILIDSDSDKPIKDNIIGKKDRFYIKFYEKPNDCEIGLKWKEQNAEIYIYEFKKGDKKTKNLINSGIKECEKIKYYNFNSEEDCTDNDKISINIKKEYSSGENESIIVSLIANNSVIRTSVLNSVNNWDYTFEDMDKKSEGENILYSAEARDASDEIKYKIKGNAEDGFIVSEEIIDGYSEQDEYEADNNFDEYEENSEINDIENEVLDSNNTKAETEKAEDNYISSPKTGDNSNISLYGILFLSSFIGIICIVKHNKRYL